MVFHVHTAVRLCVLVGISLCVGTFLAGSSPFVAGLSAPNPRPSSFVGAQRRTFLSRLPLAVIGVAASATVSTATTPFTASAYERRDVGGPDASPETKAMNLQAYETNNRLERDGVKLETAEEQSAKLTAALSDYSYSPSTGKDTKKRK